MSIPVTRISMKELFCEAPYVEDFFITMGWTGLKDSNQCLEELVESLEDDVLEDKGMDRAQILQHFTNFIQQMKELKAKTGHRLQSITVLGGRDKSGHPEDISLTLKPGDVVCIVGPTGSGKSRLLGDIECLAQRDTPTGRQILINGIVPEASQRFSIEHKLVAQLSQNMNFIMDLSAEEFIRMHAESRMVENLEETVQGVIACANELAGERFASGTPATALSGGQSRALMIADTALLSASPVVLIDEIENAGVDREKSLTLLMKKEKIVMMSTHDPILALLGHKRIIIRNGGIHRVIETSGEERANLPYLQRVDRKMSALRDRIRQGEELDFNMQEYFKK